MSGPLAIAAAAAAAAFWLSLATRVERRSAPELVAVLRLLTLVAAVVLPIALAVCTATVLDHAACSRCGGAHGSSAWLVTGLYAFAAALSIRLAWTGLRLLRATRAARVSGPVGRVATRVDLHGAEAFVLPVAEPVAYTVGLRRPHVVVSRGLLESLDRDERRALLAHELAHVRGGHQRMLFVAGVLGEALGFLPPLRALRMSLRRHLESAADAAAATAVGDRAVVARAIAKAALASAPAGTAAVAGAGDIGHRIERLTGDKTSRTACVATATAALFAGGALVVAVCLATHAGLLLANIVLCIAALGAVALPALVRGRAVNALPASTVV